MQTRRDRAERPLAPTPNFKLDPDVRWQLQPCKLVNPRVDAIRNVLIYIVVRNKRQSCMVKSNDSIL